MIHGGPAETWHAHLVDPASAIAWENYRARLDHVFACKADGYSECASCPLPPPGAHDELAGTDLVSAI